MDIQTLDLKAQATAENFRKCERELLKIIVELDKQKVYLHFGYNSLFSYITGRLRLTAAVAYNFIGVARKSKEVPQLKNEVIAGNISISKARKVAAVITPSNQSRWLKIAKETTQKQLEREIALASPNEAVQERAKYIAAHNEIKEKVRVKSQIARIQLQLGVSENLMLKFRRAQDLESQRLKRPVGLEETLSQVLGIYLQRKDPVEIAKRQKIKGKLGNESICKPNSDLNIKLFSNELPCKNKLVADELPRKNKLVADELPKIESINNSKVKRCPIPARIKHQIQLRDQGRCTHLKTNGQRCSSKIFLEIHHIRHVKNGGDNNLKNLRTLCSGHHKFEHLSK